MEVRVTFQQRKLGEFKTVLGRMHDTIVHWNPSNQDTLNSGHTGIPRIKTPSNQNTLESLESGHPAKKTIVLWQLTQWSNVSFNPLSVHTARAPETTQAPVLAVTGEVCMWNFLQLYIYHGILSICGVYVIGGCLVTVAKSI